MSADGTPLPRLIVVAHAVAPGPGGAEAEVNAVLLRALADHWPAGVTLISGGDVPLDAAGRPLSRPGWRIHPLGPCGERSGDRAAALAAWAWQRLGRRGAGALVARALNRLSHAVTGQGIKLASWQRAATRCLARELARDPRAVVWSRALPRPSIGAVLALRRRRPFHWLINLNDPMPPRLWPGQYVLPPWSERRMDAVLHRSWRLVDAVSFPSSALRRLEVEAYPALAATPTWIQPHVAVPAAAGEAAPADPRRLTLAFAGLLRGDRRRPELAAALERWRRQAPQEAADLRLDFLLVAAGVGARAYVAGLPATATVEAGGFERDVRPRLAAADALLDLESEVDAPLLLTKVTSYLGQGKPIFALCARGGTTWRLVRRAGCGWTAPLGEPQAVLDALRRMMMEWRRGELAARRPPAALIDDFGPRRQVERLARVVRHVCAAPPGRRRPLAAEAAGEPPV